MKELYTGIDGRARKAAMERISGKSYVGIHYTVSVPGLIANIRKADADGSVLFLDGLAEFSKSAVEILAEELPRFKGDCVAWMTNCPCGCFGGACHCTDSSILRYKARIPAGLMGAFTKVDVK